MNKRRFKRAALFLGLAGLLLSGGFSLWLQSYRRQENLNRQLIAALLKEDDQQALALVNAGAAPNTPFLSLPPPSLAQWCSNLLHHSDLPDMYNPTVFQIACGSPLPVEGDIIVTLKDSPELVRSMIQHGANLNAHDDIGFTPLICAASSDHPQSIGTLLDNGAEVNARDKSGYTALMRAASDRSSPYTLTLLLNHGADPNLFNKDGETALQLAQHDNQSDLAVLLRKAGAKK
jgi:hypothetical protein